MDTINYKHTILFFNFCILVSPVSFILSHEPVLICLFLILILGISHGALDNIKGKRLLNIFGLRSVSLFYFTYLSISILIIILWLNFPNSVLLLFLIVAAYHFGKEDTVFSFKRKYFLSEILFFLKGSAVIISPLLFHKYETNEIFRILNFDFFEKEFFSDELLVIFLFLSLISSLYISKGKNNNFKVIMIMDFISLIILNFFLTPVLAFTIYFCFLHSVRHSITLIFNLNKSFKLGFKNFLVKAIPLTFVTGLSFLLTIYFLNNFYQLDEAIYKVIFIGLASLTFPHILLEYLLEKNEKRT